MAELKLNALKIGFASGIVYAGFMALIIIIGNLGIFNNYSRLIMDTFNISSTLLGIVLGSIYGFLIGFLFFYIIALIYNRLL